MNAYSGSFIKTGNPNGGLKLLAYHLIKQPDCAKSGQRLSGRCPSPSKESASFSGTELLRSRQAKLGCLIVEPDQVSVLVSVLGICYSSSL